MDVKNFDMYRVSKHDELSLSCDDVTADTDNQERIENTIVNLTDSSIFRMGESFNSYEELLKRLMYHSKQSLVHYWRRDSRTVQGAYMKTARPIEPKLKYYSVKYACVYGGQKFFPRGKGQRHSITMRTNCPSHIMVRANKSGQQLEVISVCNSHNHPVSKELYRRLPQDRRLTPTVKQEVLDLLRLGVERKRVREYIRMVTGKLLTNKDLLNLGAADRRPRDALRPARAQALLKSLHELVSKGDNYNKEALSSLDMNESMDSEDSLCEEEKIDHADSTTDDATVVKNEVSIDNYSNTLGAHNNMQQESQDLLSQGVMEDNLGCPLYDSACDPIGQEVEIFYEEESNETKNIIEYFYPGSVAVMGEDSIHENDIVIENVNLMTSDLDSNDIPDHRIVESVDHRSQNNSISSRFITQSSLGKMKLKLVNLKSLFTSDNEARILIQQTPDGNENTLFSSFEDATSGDIAADAEICLKDIVVIQDPTTEGSVCNVPIQMLTLSPGGSISLKDDTVDDHGVITFGSDEHKQFDNVDVNGICIQDVENKMCTDVDENVFDEGFSCEACGRTGRESEEYIKQLKNERMQLLKEMVVLRMKRDKLRSEVKEENSVGDMWEVVKNDVNKSERLSRTWESLSDVENDDDNSEKIQYTFEP